MRRAILRLTCLSTLALAAACGGGTGGNLPDAPRARRDNNFISTEEVKASSADNAYEAVQSMRNVWLTRKRAEMGVLNNGVVVYYNGARMGYADALRNISMGPVTWIRYFDARAAQYKYGSGHPEGVILVSTENVQSSTQTEDRP